MLLLSHRELPMSHTDFTVYANPAMIAVSDADAFIQELTSTFTGTYTNNDGVQLYFDAENPLFATTVVQVEEELQRQIVLFGVPPGLVWPRRPLIEDEDYTDDLHPLFIEILQRHQHESSAGVGLVETVSEQSEMGSVSAALVLSQTFWAVTVDGVATSDTSNTLRQLAASTLPKPEDDEPDGAASEG